VYQPEAGFGVTMPELRIIAAVRSQRRGVTWVSLSLVTITVLTFFGIWNNGFIGFDDPDYLYRNRNLQDGLTWHAMFWAFNSGYANNWHPLTWLSHALDCQLFGLNPAGHHATSLVLHTANVVLLFLAMRLLTGALWRSAFVAALFAVHPLHVESVAWAAERKDVLSGLFFMLVLLTYAKYARNRSPQGTILDAGQELRVELPAPQPESLVSHYTNSSGLWYWSALGFFALGLMSKPMLVTVPFVLLLLDYWPLHRFALATFKSELPNLVREKIPFVFLTLIACALTIDAQSSAIVNAAVLPLSTRIGRAAMACLVYVQQTFWPAGLAVFYTKPALAIAIEPLAALILLLGLTAGILLIAQTRQYAAVGWLWFLGMLVPVLGLVTVGFQAHADRYTYLPSIGIFILLVWGIESALSRISNALSGFYRWLLGSVGALVVILLAVVAHHQVSFWRNSETLFTHASRVTQSNCLAMASLANLDLERGRLEEALTNAERVLEFAPGYQLAEYVAGAALQRQGRSVEAVPHLQAAAQRDPGLLVPCYARLTLCFLDAGRWQQADGTVMKILQVSPGEPYGMLMKAAVLKEAGHNTEAAALFEKVLAAVPNLEADNPALNFQIAELYALCGKSGPAAQFYSEAIKEFPAFTNALNNFAWLLATDKDAQVRNGQQAIQLAERACSLTEWKQPLLLGTLAAGYAEAGRFADAVKTAEQALSLARAAADKDVARRNEDLLELYRQGKPFREN
jgi:tetratricopeptide (TPR) repeat protein